MPAPIIYRKIIPQKSVMLKDDNLLYQDKQAIVTGWNAMTVKDELHHAYSCYCLNEGFRVSKFYRRDNSFMFWYCDIVEYDYQTESGIYNVTDLLADVIVYPDGFVKVVDLDELADALTRKLISESDLKKSLLSLNRLLSIIYSGNFDKIQSFIETFITAP